MSAKPVKHAMKVRKYNRFPGLPASGSKRHWWADCSCGSFNGFHNKRDAEEWTCPRA